MLISKDHIGTSKIEKQLAKHARLNEQVAKNAFDEAWST